MKRVLLPFFSFLLVLTLLLSSFGSAKAEVGDDPVVTPVSGDMEFTTEVIPIASLPGTLELANQMLAPVGFPAGEAQFEGAGVRVTGMDSGKATACFTLSTIAVNQGWGGKVGVWNGTKWVLLPTTIATGTDEAANTTACAPIVGNGTYAFIKWVTKPDLLPKKTVVSCGYGITDVITGTLNPSYDGVGWSGHLIELYIYSPTNLSGMTVTATLLNANPAGSYTLAGTATGVLYPAYGGYMIRFTGIPVYQYPNMSGFHWSFDFGTCTEEANIFWSNS